MYSFIITETSFLDEPLALYLKLIYYILTLRTHLSYASMPRSFYSLFSSKKMIALHVTFGQLLYSTFWPNVIEFFASDQIEELMKFKLSFFCWAVKIKSVKLFVIRVYQKFREQKNTELKISFTQGIICIWRHAYLDIFYFLPLFSQVVTKSLIFLPLGVTSLMDNSG